MDAAFASRDFERKDTRAEAARMRNSLTRVYASIGASVGMDLWNEAQRESGKMRAKK